ncbi:MAG: hypothetical protein JNJ71_02630 [Rubrivivax sp.]|nr:hypothetical protein [Rubrivivax sp.]
MLLLGAIELGIRELYHRTWGEALRMVVFGFVSCVSAGLLVAARSRARPWGRRLAVLLPILFLLDLHFGVGLRHSIDLWFSPKSPNLSTFAVLLLLLAAGLLIPQRTAVHLLRFTTGALVVYGLSGPALAAWMAPRMQWPVIEADPTGGSGETIRRGATVYLLLDEFDASQAGEVVEQLRNRGAKVAAKAVSSKGRNTIDAVPALFLLESFPSPRPCGPSALCSASSVLDFSRLTASRPDIDVVGFYHPYCRIRGLRSCTAVSVDPILLDKARWQCALGRRFPALGTLLGAPGQQRCTEVEMQPWFSLRSRLNEAVWQSRTLRDGGTLFAHLLLPHPPGLDLTKSLDQQYRDNLRLTAQLVGELVDTLNRQAHAWRMVIVSDHPLRRQQWCGAGAPFVRTGACRQPERPQEELVPLIVADSLVQPTLDQVTDNRAFFGLGAMSAR